MTMARYYFLSWGEYGPYGQIMAINGKHDHIRVINATLGQM